MKLLSVIRRFTSSFAHPITVHTLGVLLLFASLGAVAGCGSGPARTVLTEAQLQERAAANRAQTTEAFQAANRALVDRYWKALQAAPPGTIPTVHFLAMSGGGDYGAFGAGFMVGGGRRATPSSGAPTLTSSRG